MHHALVGDCRPVISLRKSGRLNHIAACCIPVPFSPNSRATMNTLPKKLTSGISSLLMRRENDSEQIRIDDAAGDGIGDSAFSSPRRTHSNQERPRLARKADPTEVAAMLPILDSLAKHVHETAEDLQHSVLEISTGFGGMAARVRETVETAHSGLTSDSGLSTDDTIHEIRSVLGSLLSAVQESTHSSQQLSERLQKLEQTLGEVNAGKSPEGTICLKAYHQGGNFIIEIQDDGKGLDRDRILRKAIERGIVSENDNLSDEDIYGLIFAAGFSTAEQVTDVSGRGVGMDVVRRNVEALQGSISIRSQKGKGCRMIVRLPLTLAILDGLLVRVANDSYVIPLLSVVESINQKDRDIKSVLSKGEVITLRGEIVPLLRLDRILNLRQSHDHTESNLLVIVEDHQPSKRPLS